MDSSFLDVILHGRTISVGFVYPDERLQLVFDVINLKWSGIKGSNQSAMVRLVTKSYTLTMSSRQLNVCAIQRDIQVFATFGTDLN